MTSSIFPDINVWVALTLKSHQHSATAWDWYRSLRPQESLAFCRVTQLGLLRLLTLPAVAGADVVSQRGAWKLYDRWLTGGGASFLDEPTELELEFRFYADRATPSPKEWTDSYLLAFAASTSMTFVTFDKGLSQRYARAVLLS